MTLGFTTLSKVVAAEEEAANTTKSPVESRIFQISGFLVLTL
jgi:hypothetical protein